MPQNEDSIEILTPIDWILVYGTARSGTSYMTRMVGRACRRFVGDWGLRSLLKEVTENKNGHLNSEQLLLDISSNILANANVKSGNQFDLVFKQAGLFFDEYKVLEKMWGKPSMAIHCFRAPDEYVHSATKKYPKTSLTQIQKEYENQIQRFNGIDGRLFDYHAGLEIEDYLSFLAPIELKRSNSESFVYKGVRDQTRTTPKMWATHKKLLKMQDSQL